MSAENGSASLVHQFITPVAQRLPQGYYRSKLFISSTYINPLIAAAGPLFSLLERLSLSNTLPPINNIRENIEHELNAFQSKLIGQQYASEFILIGSYLLSATIDELLGKNYLRLFQKPAEFRAFTRSAATDVGPERGFFDIVQYIKERTNQYLDLIELAYYCLIAGFEGEQHLKTDGRQNLDNLIEELYQIIQQNRAIKTHRLFREHSTQFFSKAVNHKPIFITISIVVGILVSIYFGSHLLLETKAKSVITNNQLLANLG